MSKDTVKNILKRMMNEQIAVSVALAEIKQIKAKNSHIQEYIHQMYSEHIFTGSDVLLSHHQLFNKPTLMGVAHLSLLVQLLNFHYDRNKCFKVNKLLLKNALSFEDSESIKLTVTLKCTADSQYDFTNSYLKASVEQIVESAQGSVCVIDVDNSERQQRSLIALLKEEHIIESFNGELFYKAADQTVYGSSLWSVKHVHQLNGEVIGEIALTPMMQQQAQQYTIHPAIFDAIHVVTSFALSSKTPFTVHWVPLYIKNIIIYPAVVDAVIASGYVRVQNILKTTELTESNAQFYSSDGQLLFLIEGFCTKRVPNAAALFNGAQTVASPEMPIELPSISIPIQPNNDDLNTVVLHYVENKLLELTGSKPDVTKNFMELGVDSNAMIKMVKIIENELSIELYPTLFFERENIKQLVSYFVAEHSAAFAHLRHPENKTKIETNHVSQVEKSVLPNIRNNFTVSPDNQSIAIIGMAGRFANADNLDEFWQNLIASKDLITEIPADHWDYRPWFSTNQEINNKTYSKWGSFLNDIDKFDPAFFGISGREAIWTDPQLRLLLEVFQTTIDDAGVGQSIQGSNTSVYVGSCFHEYWDEIVRAQIPLSDYQHVSSVMSALSTRLSYTYDLRGSSIPLDNACASSLTALHLACQALRFGENDLAFVAGANVLLSPLHYVYFSQLKALSPTGHCYSFDERGDGYVPGEGVVGVLLKPLDQALADGNRVHAVIRGSAINHVGNTGSM